MVSCVTGQVDKLVEANFRTLLFCINDIFLRLNFHMLLQIRYNTPQLLGLLIPKFRKTLQTDSARRRHPRSIPLHSFAFMTLVIGVFLRSFMTLDIRF